VVLPWHAASSRVQTIVAIVELAPPSDSSEHAQAVADCAAKLQQLAAAGSPGGAKQSVAASNWPGLAAALRAMNRPATARVAMVYLAGETGSELFGDVALVAPEPALADLSSRVNERLGDPVGAAESQQLGWMLDVATLQHLAALQAAEKVPAELAGVLARYAGEAARNAGSLEELTRVRGREQLRARLIAENFTYLEDASPSARVRAYEWLRARDRAPARYDPLGASKERSAAIDAALTPPTTAPAEPPLQAAGGAP